VTAATALDKMLEVAPDAALRMKTAQSDCVHFDAHPFTSYNFYAVGPRRNMDNINVYIVAKYLFVTLAPARYGNDGVDPRLMCTSINFVSFNFLSALYNLSKHWHPDETRLILDHIAAYIMHHLAGAQYKRNHPMLSLFKPGVLDSFARSFSQVIKMYIALADKTAK
jgi:hypothetical protein